MVNTGGLFFPTEQSPGISRRDWLAAVAMLALMPTRGLPTSLAREAYQIADAMIKESERDNG